MQSKVIVALLAVFALIGIVVAGYMAVDRIGVVAGSQSHAGVVVACKSKISRRSGSRVGAARRRWSYTPIAVTKSRQKAVGTLYFPKKSTCERLIGTTASVFVNAADPSKNRINSFTQFWFFPLVLVFVCAFVFGVFIKPALAVAVFVSFFALSTLAVALELKWFGDTTKNSDVSAKERSHLALEQCTRAAMERQNLHRKSDLKTLNCRNLGLVDVALLSEFSGLEELYLQSNDLTSLAPLWSLKKLRKLSIMHNKRLASLKGLEDLTALEELRAHSMKIKSVAPLSQLKKLRILSMSQNQVIDISPLQDLDALQRIDLNYNPIVDLSALADKPNLKRVNFYGSQVQDLTPLFGNLGLEIVGVTSKGRLNCAQYGALQQRLSPSAKVYRPKSCS